MMEKTCVVSFSIKIETSYGQNVYIMGSIPELGNWTTWKTKLHWTKGHIWRCTISLPQQHFEYKYVICNQKIDEKTGEKKIDEKVWENGRNRQCRLENVTSMVLNDIWESYRLHFLIYYPLPEGIVMRINGDLQSLGSWSYHGPKTMHLTLDNVSLPIGGEGRSWEFEIVAPITAEYIEYKYSTYNAKEDVAIWEREPTRLLRVPQRASYVEIKNIKSKTPLSEATQFDVPVNGVLTRFDVNFVSVINFDQIGDYPIIIGAYPQQEEDVKLMARSGVTGVLNVQSEIDMQHRHVVLARFQEIYSRYGIKLVHYPIHDFNAEDLEMKLKGAGAALDTLIADGRLVYVHCTAGMSRAPSTVLSYLVLYKELPFEDAWTLVKTYRKVACPNMDVLRKVLK